MIALLVQPLLIALFVERMNLNFFPPGYTKVDLAFTVTANFACAVLYINTNTDSADRCIFIYQVYGYKNTMTKGKKVILGIVWVQAGILTGLRVSINNERTTSNLFVVFSSVECLTIL